MGRPETCEIYKRRKKMAPNSLIDVENAQTIKTVWNKTKKKKRKKRVMNFVTILFAVAVTVTVVCTL